MPSWVHVFLQCMVGIAVIIFAIAMAIILYAAIRDLYTFIRRKIVKRKLKTKTLFDFNNYVTETRVNHTTCCGLCELHWLDDGPVPALAALAAWQKGAKGFEGDGYNRHGNFKPLVVFTDAVAYKNGKELADFIVKNKLGTVVTLPSSRNPNSGNMVQAWLWRIDREVWDVWVETCVKFEKGMVRD